MNNNILEFFVKMKDMASGGLAKLAQNAKQSFATVQTGIDKTITKNDRLGNSFDKMNLKAQRSGSSIAGLGRSLTAYIGIAAALSFGGGAIKSAMDYGATKQSFEVLTGSKAKGQSLAGGLNKLQQDTILGPEVFKNAQTMMGFGIGAEKVIPNLKMLGDVSMGNADKQGSLTLAFSQVQAAGRLTGQDLLQFINAGFNPLNEISKTTGKSIAELKKQMEGGAISSKMVEDSFKSATGEGGLYNNMLDKLADTPYGKLQQLMGAYEALKIKVGEALLPIATTFMTIATFLMDHIEIVLGVAAAWGTYAIVTKGAAIAQGILNGIMAINPIFLLIALIAGLIIWIVALSKKYEGWGQSLKALWEVIKAFGQMAWIPFKSFGETAWYHVQKLWLNIKDFAQSIMVTFQQVGNAWEAAKNLDFKGAKAALSTDVQTAASKEILALEMSHKNKQNSYTDQFVNAQVRMFENIGKIGLTKKETGKLTDIEPGTGTGGGGGDTGGGNGTGKNSVAGGITGSGPRVINITMGKMIETINIHAENVEKSFDEMERNVQEKFLRILNSGASVQ